MNEPKQIKYRVDKYYQLGDGCVSTIKYGSGIKVLTIEKCPNDFETFEFNKFNIYRLHTLTECYAMSHSLSFSDNFRSLIIINDEWYVRFTKCIDEYNRVEREKREKENCKLYDMNGNELKVGNTVRDTYDNTYLKILSIQYPNTVKYAFGKTIVEINFSNFTTFDFFRERTIKIEICPTCGAELRKK